MDPIIGVNTNCYHGCSVEDALQSIHSAGFRYVELTATRGWTEHVYPNQSFFQLQKIKDLMKELKLTPFALSGHCNLMDTQRLDEFILNMKLAHFYGAEYIISSVGDAHEVEEAGSFESSERQLIKNLHSLIPVLDELGLRLMLEIHGDHGTGASIGKIVQTIDSPLIGMNYDTANAIFYGGIDPLEDIPHWLDSIGYIHIKDKVGGVGEWNFPALGRGDINFIELKNILGVLKNSPPLSVEIEFTPDTDRTIETIHQAVVDSYNYLKTIGYTP